MTLTSQSQVWMAGGGIATMATAAFLIRDAGIPGENIHFLEQLEVVGGSMDGARSPVPDEQKLPAYVTRGGRMFEEEAYQCLWNLLASIPTIENPNVSVFDEFRSFYRKLPPHSKARIINADRTIADAADLGFRPRDRVALLRLLSLPERLIGTRRITDFFDEEFFASHFWTMWRTTFAFQNWHSAIELKRYFLRFTQEFDRIHTLAGVRRSVYNQYDSVIRPIEAWLTGRGADVRFGTRVEDADFVGDKDSRRVSALHVRDTDGPRTIELGEHDYAVLTLGSMTADSDYAGDDTTTELIADKRDASWTLWENIARKFDDFGRPSAFCAPVSETKWKSFTLTMHDPALLEAIETYTGNPPGEGNLVTWHQSRWLMSIVVPYQPHFRDQLPGTCTLWGYALFSDVTGDYVGKTIEQCTGAEILDELLGHLGFDQDLNARVRETTTVTHVQMPYIDSQFQRRAPSDRPQVVPPGAENFAFVGQFVEIPEDVVFTVEYSVHAGMIAAYTLAGVDKPIPPIYHAMAHPDVAWRATRTLLTDQARGEDPDEAARHDGTWIVTD